MKGFRDLPPCTCLTRPVFGGFRAVVVLDPFCHIPQHKQAATYPVEPEYPAANGG